MSSTALAEEPQGAWSHEITYTADVTGVVGGAPVKAGRFLDNLDIILDGDLGKAIGWHGAKLHLYVLNNTGGEPSTLTGSLQGIDNIEVTRPRTRLFELWIEQGFADDHAAILAGLYDLNSDFYSTDASSQFLAPPFGIGSELAATGPNGPSIFPSTALAARLRIGQADGSYVEAAVFDADSRTLGDPHGIDTSFDHGVLMIAEASWRGPLRLALGGWRYSRRQDDIREVTPTGVPTGSIAEGGYLLAEGVAYKWGDGHAAHAFLRAGFSDGDTTQFQGAWQAGVRFDKVFASRPASTFSIGAYDGGLSRKARANLRDSGLAPSRSEDGVEITYSDTVGHLTVQPDLQIVRHPGGIADAEPAVIAAVRLSVDLN
jgi:porin